MLTRVGMPLILALAALSVCRVATAQVSPPEAAPAGWASDAAQSWSGYVRRHQHSQWLSGFPWTDSNPDSNQRHIGLGQPLEGTSWLNRPWHVDWFVGGLFGSSLTGRVSQGDEIFGGYRLGYDASHYWGTELRWGFAYPPISNTQGLPRPRSTRNIFLDVHWLYYPWGDARWRPYTSLGMGVAGFHFQDDLDRGVNRTVFHLPIGIGCKYQWRRWLALRADLMDNIAFGSGQVSTMHNFSLTCGVEVRMGGSAPSYYPW